jgi:hypothetical protein
VFYNDGVTFRILYLMMMCDHVLRFICLRLFGFEKVIQVNMICYPLVISGACFVVPAVIAFVRKRKMKDGMAMSVLGCTSVWFHSTYNTLAYTIDKMYAHVFAAYYVTKAMCVMAIKKRRYDVIACVFSVSTIVFNHIEGKFPNMTPQHTLTHMGIHMCALTALLMYVFD